MDLAYTEASPGWKMARSNIPSGTLVDCRILRTRYRLGGRWELFFLREMEPPTGIEPATPSLPWMCSTTELGRLMLEGQTE